MRVEDFITDLLLTSGGTLNGARCRYAVWGELNATRDNLVLYPTRFGGTHVQNAFLIGPDMALDPRRYCVVVPNMMGNGESSSPSNTPDFPDRLTHADNVNLQRRLLAARFGDAPIALAVGWSMGAQQSYRWAVEEPDRVARLLTICGTARTTPHNRVFLEGVLAALSADPRFGTTEAPLAGLRAAGRVYAGWAYSQSWVKRAGYLEAAYQDTFGPFATLDDWLEQYWDKLFMARHAGDLVACARTWMANDVSDGGDLPTALGRIRAKSIVATARTDLYFTPEDCRAEAEMIHDAQYVELDTDWGHMCGSGQSASDTARIDALIRTLLD